MSNKQSPRPYDNSEASEYLETTRSAKKEVNFQQTETDNSKSKMKKAKDNAHKKPNKYHYHLKTDQIYGDKKLKLCGQCTIPSNLSRDLRTLEKYVKRSNSNEQIQDTSKLNNSNSYLATMKSTPGIDLYEDNSFQIDFNVLDLTMERQTGTHLPILYLPPDLFRFKQLVRLHLDGNHIKAVPELLGENLANLEILTLTNNHLRTLPDSLAKLKKLSSLHIATNRFEEFPSVVCYIPTLRFLDMSTNQMQRLNGNIGNLKNLESLLLYENLLTELPDSIGQLVKLRTLWLGNNKLTKLPKQILNLKSLEWDDNSFNLSSNIEGNPLTEPPYEFCLQGMTGINNYFRSNNNISRTKSRNKQH
jgi:Leucine-rich repeat (LRR) protein